MRLLTLVRASIYLRVDTLTVSVSCPNHERNRAVTGREKTEREKGYEAGKEGDEDSDFLDSAFAGAFGCTEFGEGYEAGKNDRDDDE